MSHSKHTEARTLADCIQNHPPLTITATASVLDAARLMVERHCGSVLVVSTDKSLIGGFTERDLLVKVVARSLDPASTRIANVMTPAPELGAHYQARPRPRAG